jgi:hypothetical protein
MTNDTEQTEPTTVAAPPPTPELDRQREIIDSGRAGTVQEFYDWLTEERGFSLARPKPDSIHGYYEAVFVHPEQLMADFFGIDRDKIETERQANLAHLRSQQ